MRKYKILVLFIVLLTSWSSNAGKADYYEYGIQKSYITSTLRSGKPVPQNEIEYFFKLIKEGDLIENRQVYLEGIEDGLSMQNYYRLILKSIFCYYGNNKDDVLKNLDLFIDRIFSLETKFSDSYPEEVIGTALYAISIGF